MTQTATGMVQLNRAGVWLGEAAVQRQRFPDANVVRSAYAWLLAPLARGTNGQLQAGYSAAIADADEDRFVLARPQQPFPPTDPRFDFAGVYHPYYTPARIVAHSVIAAITAGKATGPRLAPEVRMAFAPGKTRQYSWRPVTRSRRLSNAAVTRPGPCAVPSRFPVSLRDAEGRRRVGPHRLLPLDDRQRPAPLPIHPGRARRHTNPVTGLASAGDVWMERWRHRSAPEVRFVDRLILFSLTAAGLVAVIQLTDWWFRRTHVADPALFVGLSLAFWYGISRIVIGWMNYLAVDRPAHRPASPGLRVAIFTTSSSGEPVEMFERTLEACARVRYPHTTYLLDDTQDPRFREVAERHGAVWLELVGLPGAKAGKINRALELTTRNSFSSWIRTTYRSPNSSTGCSAFFGFRRRLRPGGAGLLQPGSWLSQRRPRPNRRMRSMVPHSWVSMGMAQPRNRRKLHLSPRCARFDWRTRHRPRRGFGDRDSSPRGRLAVRVRPEIVSRGLVPEDLGSSTASS